MPAITSRSGASSKMWELPSWVSYYGLAPEDWPRFREYVRNALTDGPLTRGELAAALRRSSRYRHLGAHVADGNYTLLKPLTWQGDMGLGVGRNGEATFLRLDAVPGWGGIPDLEEAGPRVVEAYFRIYGPAAPERVQRWLGPGLDRCPAVAGARSVGDGAGHRRPSGRPAEAARAGERLGQPGARPRRRRRNVVDP